MEKITSITPPPPKNGVHGQRNVKDGIGFKLTVIISAALLVVFAAKATYDAVVDYSSEIAENVSDTTAQNQLLASNLERTFAEVHQTCLDFDSLIQYELALPPQQRSRTRLIEHTKQLLQKNSAVQGLAPLFEPNAFDGRDAEYANNGFYKSDGRFVPYVERSGSEITLRIIEDLYTSADVQWYTRPIQEKVALMISPFEFGGGIITTLAIPIIHNGKAIGVINADVDVSSLQSRLEKIPGTTKENFKLLCSGDGTIVANGIDTSRILQNQFDLNPEFRELFKAIARKETAEQTAMSHTSGMKSKFILVPVDVSGVAENWAFISITALSVFTAQAKQNLTKTIIIYIFILILVVIILYVLVRQFISKPLRFTSDALKNIAQGEGDLTVRLPVRGKDEIAELSGYFNETIAKIGSAIKAVDENSNVMQSIGDELSSNMTETASALNEISANIDGVKEQAMTQAASVTETSSTVEEIIRTIEQLNNSIESQSASVVQSSASVEQMVSNISSINQSIAKSDSLIKILAEATSSGKQVLLESNSVTQRIAEASGGLIEASNIIRNIADQTNLLAMNAAIEAAHAGDAGKGFAVVADEIRKLAEESSVQGKTITETLKKLGEEINGLAGSSKVVEEKFNSIYELSEEVLKMSSQLTSAMAEQENGSMEVLSAIKNISTVTSEVKSGSEEMLLGGRGVASEMQKLDGLTAVIKDSMNEMVAGVGQINKAVQDVSDLAEKNKGSIGNLVGEVKKFKV